MEGTRALCWRLVPSPAAGPGQSKGEEELAWVICFLPGRYAISRSCVLSLQSAALSPRPCSGSRPCICSRGGGCPRGCSLPRAGREPCFGKEPGLGVPQQAQKSRCVSAQVCGAFKIKTEVKSKLSARLKASRISSREPAGHRCGSASARRGQGEAAFVCHGRVNAVH